MFTNRPTTRIPLSARAALIICVAGAMALLAAPAWANAVHYDGKIQATNGGNVHFDVVNRNGKPRRVKNVTFDEMKLHCENGSNTFVGGSFGAATGKLSRDGSFKLDAGEDRFRGRIGDGGHAHGKITYHFAHPFAGACVNRQHDWSASA